MVRIEGGKFKDKLIGKFAKRETSSGRKQKHMTSDRRWAPGKTGQADRKSRELGMKKGRKAETPPTLIPRSRSEGSGSGTREGEGGNHVWV